MKLTISKSSLNGSVAIPASKSHTIRAVAIAALAYGKSYIRNPLISSDTLSAAKCYQVLGAEVNISDDSCWQVQGTAGEIIPPKKTIDVGNSGTTLRLAAGSAALTAQGQRITFTGDDQICSRPIGPLLKSLTDLGASAKSLNNNDKAPIEITGQLTGGATTIECVTSQYLSSLLMVAPLAQNDTEINVTLLNEPDYVQMTLDWLDRQTIEYKNENMKRFLIKGSQQYKNFDLHIPADFSSATFFLCAAAVLNADVTLTGLDFSDSQPDKAVVDYLKQMGANIQQAENSVRITTSQLNGTEIDMNRTPDALPAMAVTACFAKGPTKLYNVAQARKKETDRITCMADELAKMNIKTTQLPDGLIIHPATPKAAQLNGHGDHRIVMALSIAAMAIDDKSTIDTAEAINVTFPNYVKLMQNLGANINLQK